MNVGVGAGIRRSWSWKSASELTGRQLNPVIEPLLQPSHHLGGNRKAAICYGPISWMGYADTHLNEVSGSTVAIAEEPDVCCDKRIPDILHAP